MAFLLLTTSHGFDYWHSLKFILMLLKFINGAGLRKVGRGLKILIKPI